MAFHVGFNGAKAETSESIPTTGGFRFGCAVAPFVDKHLNITKKLEDGVEVLVIVPHLSVFRLWFRQNEDLALEDFVREEPTIPTATFHDYAECFTKCLQPSFAGDYTSDLTPAQDDPYAWTLVLKMKLRVFVTEWTPTYTMLLQPIALEATDLLAAKIRDQEDQIQFLIQQVKALAVKVETQAMTPPVFVTGRSVQSTCPDEAIVWVQDGSAKVGISFRPSGVIRFAVAATFVINLMVQNNCMSNNVPTVGLFLNGKLISVCKDSSPNAHVEATPFCHVLTTNVGDELQVAYKGNNNAMEGSQVAIYQLR